MSKSHIRFLCSHCGGVQPRWMGKCPDCGEWNTLNEQRLPTIADDPHRPVLNADDLAEAAATAGEALVIPIDEIRTESAARATTGLAEFDRVLGGGLVPGSSILIGGDPGIGKSTLLLQVAHLLAKRGRRVIYVSSEESPGQTRLRAERLGIVAEPAAEPPIDSKNLRNGKPQSSRTATLNVASQANLDVITNLLTKHRPDVVVVDSIQMIYRPELSAAPGSAVQLRDAAARLVWLAKQLGFALFLVGHVTKEGALAGPKLLEHLVDCVIYFEGDRHHAHRMIRAVKNRFGASDEIGIFEMTGSGLMPVEDPSTLFLQTQRKARAGSVVLAACEGTRTLLVEVQALCAQSVFGAAKRKSTGVDSSRLAMILAVLEKHADCVLGDQDVFVNIVGGVRVVEPAADLAIALAVFGAFTGRSLPESTVACGELGLDGELRSVRRWPQRLMEASRVGFRHMLAPESTRKGETTAPASMEFLGCETLAHAIRHLV